MAVSRMRNEKHVMGPLFMAETPNFPRRKGIGVSEHDNDVRFVTGSRNMAVLRMCNEKNAI